MLYIELSSIRSILAIVASLLNFNMLYIKLSKTYLIWPLSHQGQGHPRPSNVSPFTAIMTVRSCNPTLVQARKLILGIYIYGI